MYVEGLMIAVWNKSNVERGIRRAQDMVPGRVIHLLMIVQASSAKHASSEHHGLGVDPQLPSSASHDDAP